MKKILVLLLLMVVSTTVSAEWTEVGGSDNNTKNITISVDEFSHNQTSGSMVQTINEVNSIKPFAKFELFVFE